MSAFLLSESFAPQRRPAPGLHAAFLPGFSFWQLRPGVGMLPARRQGRALRRPPFALPLQLLGPRPEFGILRLQLFDLRRHCGILRPQFGNLRLPLGHPCQQHAEDGLGFKGRAMISSLTATSMPPVLPHNLHSRPDQSSRKMADRESSMVDR